MRPDDIKNAVEQLNLNEKLHLVEDIWDSIAMSNAIIPLAEWQKKELKKRYNEFEDNNLNLQEWESVHGDLRKKHQ